MKLYEKYKDLLKERFDDGYSLSKAWFTTFTLSPEFFESYLLPPLLQKYDEIPKSYIQFEELNASLAQTHVPDIRVFHDAGIPVDGIKKTTVSFIGIKPEKGLFHPKVCLFVFTKKDKENKAYLMVGSANIGIDGWGRNRESVLIREVRTREHKDSINDFFTGVCGEVALNEKFDLLDSGKTWHFIHSYSITNFIEALKNKKQQEWKVWSPYFSDASFIPCVAQELKSKIYLIPDLVDNKIRMEQLPADFKVYSDGYEATNRSDHEHRFCHAKVWLSEEWLVVGSHNFTRPALEQNNIEASIAEYLVDKVFFNSVELKEVTVSPMSQDEFEHEQLPTAQYYFSIQITADHEGKNICLKSEALKVGQPLMIFLPGLSEAIVATKWGEDQKSLKIELSIGDSYQFWKALVINKQVIAENADGQIGQGFILETNTSMRQAFEYSSLQTLMIDFLSGKTNAENSSNSRMVHVAEKMGIDTMDSTINANANWQIDYFHIYSFFYQLRVEFKSKWSQNPEQFIWFQPNGFKSIKELIEKLIKSHNASDDLPLFIKLVMYEFNHSLDSIFLNSDKLRVSANQLKFDVIQLEKNYEVFLQLVYAMEATTS